jgi:hypothetical protein
MRELITEIFKHTAYLDRIAPQTMNVSRDGRGYFSVPSVDEFQHLTPHSSPSGLIFQDGSFLTIKEIFRYDYANEDDTDPDIVPLEFSYHYQIPHRGFFFRCDHHPDIGDSATHPPYHLHVGCWHEGDIKLPSLPRFPVPEMTLEAVLNLIVRDFLNPQETD